MSRRTGILHIRNYKSPDIQQSLEEDMGVEYGTLDDYFKYGEYVDIRIEVNEFGEILSGHLIQN